MRRMTRLGAALCGLLLIGATAARAIEIPAADPAPRSAVHPVQFDGPGYGGPGGGMGPEYGGGPGYGGPGYGGPGFGGPGYGGPGGGMGRGFGPGGPGGRNDAAGPHRYISYHGFRIDVGRFETVMDPTSVIRSVEHQIDIVDRVGLSPSMLALFRRFPIRVSPNFAEGSHYSGGSDVVLGSEASSVDKPVLLHEFMHVLHGNRMPQGFRNPTILHFYDEAVARGLYEPGSYMLSNHREFFAMTASCFLNGTVARAPYTREAIREKQPDYYAYLAHLFGRSGIAQGGPSGRLAAVAH